MTESLDHLHEFYQFCNGIGKVNVENKGKNECPQCVGEGSTAYPLYLGSTE